ncbi:MAG: pilus assembly PilX N-terminal domain-containing protein [Candidatus Moranbacteria bacterium]|nr:pilus assembly PilX N-terminal domain-containing protein [Candidatus Moranbacteria bacterium]
MSFSRYNLRSSKRNQKGSALVYALVILAIVMIILVSMLTYISAQLKFSFNRVEKERAFQTAEAGIYYYRWYLAHETSGKTAQQISDFWEGGTAIGVSSPYESEYEGIGKYKVEVDAPDSGSTIVTVKSTGWTYKMPNITRTVQVRFRRPSWSEYMWVVNDFINFGTGAEVYGKVHSNIGILFNGLAHNVVSCLVPSFNDPTHGGSYLDFGVHTHQVPADPAAPAYPWPDGTVPDRPDIFMGGRQFPIPEVSFSGILSDLGNMKSEAQGGHGKYFDATGAGRRIILKSDGTYDICTVDSYHHTAYYITSYLKNSGTGTCSSCSEDCLSNYPILNDRIIFVENNAWVEGTVNNKRVTIAAANLSGGPLANIYIGLNDRGTGNIRYTNYDCNNIIGLVAQQNISIVRDCPDNFVVDAALLAQSGRISRGNYAINRSTLTFNGALASYLQPYFNTGNNGFGIRTYNFDNNLLYCPPPYFPTGTEYSIDLWEEL